jgi:hypothetical protein
LTLEYSSFGLLNLTPKSGISKTKPNKLRLKHNILPKKKNQNEASHQSQDDKSAPAHAQA